LIVGVVDDVQQYALDKAPDAAVYVPLRQVRSPQGWTSLVIRTAMPPQTLEPQVRAAMAALDPLEPVFHMQPMGEYISLSLSLRTLTLTLIGVFGALACALAMGGVYSVMSCGLQQQLREVALRLALGATPRDMFAMIGRQVLATAGIAVAAGFALDLAFSRLLKGLLFGVTPLDPVTMIVVAAVIVIVALASSYIPMRRAASVEPMAVLRGE
jgi:predicted lysophospholipase L1 biosynthesis ABC-type transport system permease subunit